MINEYVDFPYTKEQFEFLLKACTSQSIDEKEDTVRIGFYPINYDFVRLFDYETNHYSRILSAGQQQITGKHPAGVFTDMLNALQGLGVVTFKSIPLYSFQTYQGSTDEPPEWEDIRADENYSILSSKGIQDDYIYELFKTAQNWHISGYKKLLRFYELYFDEGDLELYVKKSFINTLCQIVKDEKISITFFLDYLDILDRAKFKNYYLTLLNLANLDIDYDCRDNPAYPNKDRKRRFIVDAIELILSLVGTNFDKYINGLRLTANLEKNIKFFNDEGEYNPKHNEESPVIVTTSDFRLKYGDGYRDVGYGWSIIYRTSVFSERDNFNEEEGEAPKPVAPKAEIFINNVFRLPDKKPYSLASPQAKNQRGIMSMFSKNPNTWITSKQIYKELKLSDEQIKNTLKSLRKGLKERGYSQVEVKKMILDFTQGGEIYCMLLLP